MKKKKLFIWHYRHDFTICALNEDGKMIAVVLPVTNKVEEVEETKQLLFADNKLLDKEYTVNFIDQKALEEHMYEGGPRSLIPVDFQHAWDLYRGISASAN